MILHRTDSDLDINSGDDYFNSINFKNYSKDDLDIDDTEVLICKICYDVIWNNYCLKCSNNLCNESNESNVCLKCSRKMIKYAIINKEDFICPFCRSVITKKEEFIQDEFIRDNTEQNSRENYTITIRDVEPPDMTMIDVLACYLCCLMFLGFGLFFIITLNHG